MVELARTDALAHFDQSRQWDHRVTPATHVDAVDVFGCGAAARLGLHDHVVLLGVALVARDLPPAEHGFQRLGHDLDASAPCDLEHCAHGVVRGGRVDHRAAAACHRLFEALQQLLVFTESEIHASAQRRDR